MENIMQTRINAIAKVKTINSTLLSKGYNWEDVDAFWKSSFASSKLESKLEGSEEWKFYKKQTREEWLEIISSNRTNETVFARFIGYKILSDLEIIPQQIGKIFNRDRATVRHGILSYKELENQKVFQKSKSKYELKK